MVKDELETQAQHYKGESVKMFIIIFVSIVLALGCFYIYLLDNTRTAEIFTYKFNTKFGIRKLRKSQDPYDINGELGYQMLPGTYYNEIKIYDIFKPGWRYRSWNAIINDDRTRFTGKKVGFPEINIYGCSFTFGYALDDKETYPHILQDSMPRFNVRNFGMNGYGNLHYLIQLKRYLEWKQTPKYAIFNYIPFHMDRNVASSSWLKLLNTQYEDSYKYPRGTVDNGILNISMVDIEKKPKHYEPSYTDKFHVTLHIFAEIEKTCRQNDIMPVILTAVNGDSVVTACQELGFKIIGIPDFLIPEYQLYPFDGHTNYEANKEIAEAIKNFIRWQEIRASAEKGIVRVPNE